MTDIFISIFVFLSGAAAVVYGYMNWRITRGREDLRWIFVGITVIVLVAFDFTTIHVLTLDSRTQNRFHWVRLVCDIGVVLLALTLKIRGNRNAGDRSADIAPDV
jgi:hypothetical protein